MTAGGRNSACKSKRESGCGDPKPPTVFDMRGRVGSLSPFEGTIAQFYRYLARAVDT
jgi:hypothetical protein